MSSDDDVLEELLRTGYKMPMKHIVNCFVVTEDSSGLNTNDRINGAFFGKVFPTEHDAELFHRFKMEDLKLKIRPAQLIWED